MQKHLLFAVFCLFTLTGCADKYMKYRSGYTYKATAGNPDYNNPENWAALPSKHDPSDSIPAPLQNETRDSLVDVFFIHPTTFTKKKDRQTLNAVIDDPYLNAKTDYSSILYQASVFNQHARIFAPRYRQAHIYQFYNKDTAAAHTAFELAYTDIKSAFDWYLEHENKGRPFIIAAHSQGSLHSKRLIREYIENKPLMKQLVAAYIAGWPVEADYFSAVPLCMDSTQTGCVCSWRTLHNGYRPSYTKKEKEIWVTNPLSWTTSDTLVKRSANQGSLVRFNKLYKKTTDARISNGLLYTRRPRFPWSFLFRTRNYHVGDINLYYMDIRHNAEQRINSYRKQHPS